MAHVTVATRFPRGFMQQIAFDIIPVPGDKRHSPSGGDLIRHRTPMRSKTMLRFSLITLLLGSYSLCLTTTHAAAPPTGVAAYDAAVAKGVAFLKQQIAKESGAGEQSLAAYVLVKAGESPTSPAVTPAVKAVRARIKSGKYTPSDQSHHAYVAGVDAMLLADTGGEQYRPELQAIADYLASVQKSDGSWDYPGDAGDVGDTSMAQYAVLGLWAADRAGASVPLSVWDRAAAWHIKTQFPDGGFAYHPGIATGSNTGDGKPQLNMSAGAAGTLAVIKLHLYPDSANPKAKSRKGPAKKFGVLQARVEAPPEEEKPKVKSVGRATTPLGAIERSISRAMGWVQTRFQPVVDGLYCRYYYNYAMERSCALNKIETLGTIDWYRAGGDQIAKEQAKDGSWNGDHGKLVGTSFAILFFIKATKQTVVAQFGAGLLHGGRGLDLDNSEIGRDGKVKKKREITDPLDQLLTDLAKQDPEELERAQMAIVEKVQLGSRDELLGQMDRIRKLITNDNPEIRRTAVWALGRSGDLRDAYLLINALEDTHVDVLVESYNALSYLSRKISGVGIPSDPLADLPEGATQAQMDATVDRWRREALKRWSAWYFRVRPYEERNDLFELRFGAAIGNRKP